MVKQPSPPIPRRALRKFRQFVHAKESCLFQSMTQAAPKSNPIAEYSSGSLIQTSLLRVSLRLDEMAQNQATCHFFLSFFFFFLLLFLFLLFHVKFLDSFTVTLNNQNVRANNPSQLVSPKYPLTGWATALNQRELPESELCLKIAEEW